ncbi:hypothetical protein JVT61DRAFT_1110 [Boletus reticuloceps]|uniref:Uncharacterized protein n=1 Tax=Boletus reticuloceps TaxID=495285 RepID=A0A8I3AC87_9AGAM|nr:hypothetical protein JVT61DRAFT_1110 [Boletus reticuloceps]
MSKTPAAILTDALTAFNSAANLALTTAQDQARKDVTQATADVREARRERDDAVNALHASRLEEQAWKQEAAIWKATVRTIPRVTRTDHHLETIAQLREEATQWKNQCLRLEETSRQEAISWKEQFLRVEQERSKLAQRVEELVAEQHSSGGHARTSVAPYTPVVRYSAADDLSASTRLQHASALDSLSPSLHERLPSKSTFPTSRTTSRAWRTRPGPVSQLPSPLSENQRSARQRPAQETVPPVAQPGPVSNGTRQVFIRRVRAVVEVPVKEESVDREGTGLLKDVGVSTSASKVATTSTLASTSTSKTPNAFPKISELSKATSRVKRKATKRTYVEVDDDSEGGPKQSDADEYMPVSDDDDELLMGIEINRKEVYGMKRVPKPISVQKTSQPSMVVKRRKELAKKSRPSTPSKP